MADTLLNKGFQQGFANDDLPHTEVNPPYGRVDGDICYMAVIIDIEKTGVRIGLLPIAAFFVKKRNIGFLLLMEL